MSPGPVAVAPNPARDSRGSRANSGRKPNPRAFSSTDCHTCSSLGRSCDRQRPQCSTCILHKTKCGGFATQLSWDRCWNWRMPPRKKPLSHEASALPQASNVETGPAITTQPTSREAINTPTSRSFKFVNGRRPKRRRRATLSRDGHNIAVQQVTSHNLDSLARLESRHIQEISPPVLTPAGATSGLGSNRVLEVGNDKETTECTIPSASLPEVMTPTISAVDTEIETSFWYANDFYDMDDFGGSLQDHLNSADQSRYFMESGNSNILPNDSSLLEMSFNSSTNLNSALNIVVPDYSNPFPASILNPIQPAFQMKCEDFLELYDREYCVLPLTSDTSDLGLNPFRCREQTSRGSRLLLHAILALCFRHMNHNESNWSTEAMEHKTTAQNLLQCAVQGEHHAVPGLAILDAILIMFTLDCTWSAFGTWTTHLTRARHVLDTCGGPDALETPRLRSQVGMLVWWDATLALISRQGLVIPERYLKHVVNFTNRDAWSFYELSGCPQDLFLSLVELARLSRENEVVSTMEWASFNLTPVLRIEKTIKTWQCSTFANRCSVMGLDEDVDQSEEDNYQFQQDIFHCAEAWRYTLLIYIERVFKWDRNGKPPRALGRYVRCALDHIKCCQRTSLVQKQLLLPVFLAGAETEGSDARDMIRSYCDWWAEKSRYRMFSTVSALLEEIWIKDSPYMWWGAAIDSKTKSSSPDQKPQTFLFG